MSRTLPMTTLMRATIYGRDGDLTNRQARQMMRQESLEEYRAIGDLEPHAATGATGVPTRRPIVRPSAPPERGSIRTHVAVRCDDRCGVHLKPRLHRVPKRT